MIAAYLTDTVTRIISGGLDAYNERQAPTQSAHAAQVNWGTRIVRDGNGAEVVASGNICSKVKYDLADAAIIDGRTHSVVAVEEMKTFSRIDGYRVWFA